MAEGRCDLAIINCMRPRGEGGESLLKAGTGQVRVRAHSGKRAGVKSSLKDLEGQAALPGKWAKR